MEEKYTWSVINLAIVFANLFLGWAFEVSLTLLMVLGAVMLGMVIFNFIITSKKNIDMLTALIGIILIGGFMPSIILIGNPQLLA